MTEPVSTAATGTAISVGTVTLVGTVFGMRYDLLLLGLFGGLLRLSKDERTNRKAAFSSVALSTLLAGAVSPVAGAFFAHLFNLQANVDEFRICAAVLIGYGWQAMMPAIWDLIIQKYGGKEMS